MQEKDLAEKHLESYDDVYKDIVNVLLFQGEEVIQSEAFEHAMTRSSYISQKHLHGQERDVAKYWGERNIRLAFLGIENQSTIDKAMPLRIMGYDGAAYRAQLLEKKKQTYYPVITLVLYFGYKRRWKNSRSLLDCLNVPEKLKPYVNDYKINLFEIAYLTEETVAKFKSDFRIIADYFVQMRKKNTYVPNKIIMKHTYETMLLLSTLTKDDRFLDVCKVDRKGGMTMCEVLDRVEKRGFKAGEKRGEKRGRFEMLKELVEEGILTVSEAAKRINMSEESFRNKMC